MSQCVADIRPLKVYLDSADYSVLSDTRIQTPIIKNTRIQLKTWSDSGQVEFWYSGAHVSEMAPVKPEYTEDAVKRAEMLCKLCKRHALVSFEHLIQNELDCLSTKKSSQYHIYSFSGNWFPNVTDIVSPVSWLDGIKEVDKLGKSIGLNREMRRAIRRKNFKNERPRERLQQEMVANKPDLSDLIARYPMREEYARILERYAVGQATKIQAEEAFFESLRDPVWMMKWFHSHSKKCSPLFLGLGAPPKL